MDVAPPAWAHVGQVIGMASAAFNGAGAGSNGGGSHGSPLLPQSPLLAPASAVPSPQQRLAELESTTVHGAAGAAAAAARAPNTEVYGFVMYLASFITFGALSAPAMVPRPRQGHVLTLPLRPPYK